MILFSGGLDSIALANYLGSRGFDLVPVYMFHRASYGNTTKHEVGISSRLAHEIFGRELVIFKPRPKGKENWAQYGEIRYTDQMPVPKEEKSYRNRRFLSVLCDAGMGNEVIALGTFDGEGEEERTESLSQETKDDLTDSVLQDHLRSQGCSGTIMSWGTLGISNKTDMLHQIAGDPVVEEQIGSTWSCQMYYNRHCGKCFSCKGRAKAMMEAFGHDPTEYREGTWAWRRKREEANPTPPRPEFVVRSPEQGLTVIQHQDITANYEKALRWKPRAPKAVLLPCAGVKPFTEASSHAHGYLPALEGKDVDLWIVAEPLAVVPQAWSETYPNNAYDYPPDLLTGPARDLLVERIGHWFSQVAPKYEKIYIALPSHHRRLVQEAISRSGWSGEILDVGLGDGFKRPTSKAYRQYLKAAVANPTRRFHL